MKYFVNKWFEPNTTDEELNKIRDSYWESLKKISNKFPNQIYNLAFDTNLHDGIIFKIIINKNKLSIDLSIRIGDLQNGYENLQLKYLKTSIDKKLENKLKNIIDKDLEILYDEVSIEKGKFVHSFLFTNHKEINIIFSELEISKNKVPDRFIKEKSFINKST